MSDPVSPVPCDAVVWESVHNAVNAWRGRCLNAFARAEHAVTEALVRLSEDSRHGAAVKLPHLVGQRFEALANAIGEGGPFADGSAQSFAALVAFREHDVVRAPLCHGLGKISVDQSGRWTLVMRMTSLKGRRAERLTFVWDEHEAKGLSDRIHSDAQRLHSRLARLFPAAKAS